ncbi:M15 family metallopeptidase [Moraxella catarrhalis]|uniref:D-alanyl-D-alanine dipeptidase n=1 Tax=Moraxella catarrhalis TaxID=480 RepID=A0A198UI63_MORCA|nr:M15 family metallopeptidase [Moraxella catarrhalis]OAU94922.1 D-alanyl-D-alanine dipeptidase [Moraxella catarrhalis]OAU98583.1 D-alanyl-D-alanine dipeptidase [Moraxella catarrhalis]OAU98738.1 D-alanyl-D-alanine dipeptidase [Moraxella catarrhalis]
MMLDVIPLMAEYEWKDLQFIEVIDCSEDLHIISNDEKIRSYPFYFHQKVPNSIDFCAARSSVIKKLHQAAKLLPENLGIIVLDAWRPKAVQLELQRQVSNIIDLKYPQLSLSERNELLLKFVAPANQDFISPHSTGGSIDVTLFDIETGSWINMGSGFDEPSERSYTGFYEKLPDHPACYYRRLLFWAMINSGFSNLPSEWWHFDYGNQLWACYNKQKSAFYASVSEVKI